MKSCFCRRNGVKRKGKKMPKKGNGSNKKSSKNPKKPETVNASPVILRNVAKESLVDHHKIDVGDYFIVQYEKKIISG